MAIQKVKNPRGGKEMILANGVVRAVYFNEIKPEHRKDFGKDGKSWIPTHRVVVQVDDEKIGAGLAVKEDGKELVLRARMSDNDKEFADVVKGAEVSIEVQEDGEYKGVKQYKCFPKDILVVKKAETTSTGTAAPKQKADPTELIAGNARNTAAILVRRFGVDFNEAITYAAQVSHNAKVEYAATDSKLTSYQVGVSVGEAVKVAAELAQDMDSMPDYITAYLADQVPHSLSVVKGMADEKEFVTPELPAEAGKTKPAKPKAAPKPKKEEVKEDVPSVEDDDDTIPF